jgi:group I intron endonuclease
MLIYCIRNKINNKHYVGQTSLTFKKRYPRGWEKTCNSALKNAVKKYGKDNFEVEILENNLLSKEDTNKKETFWAEKLAAYSPTGYNLVSCGNSRIPTDETRRKMSQSHMGKTHSIETRTQLGNRLRLYLNSEEGKKKLSETSKKMWQRPGFKEKMSVKSKARFNPKLVTAAQRPETRFNTWFSKVVSGMTKAVMSSSGKLYPSSGVAATIMQCHTSSIKKCCLNYKKFSSAAGFEWKFIPRENSDEIVYFLNHWKHLLKDAFLVGGIRSLANKWKELIFSELDKKLV